jgi:5-methylcytosine-specific restriction endonuclease McrA
LSNKLCRVCGTALEIGDNWANSNAKYGYCICRKCQNKQSRERLAANRNSVLAQAKTRRDIRKEVDADALAADDAIRYARRQGWRPPDGPSRAELIEETLPLYARARRLTRDTGVMHVVDHKKPLALGGEHRAFNLQVITQQKNAQKKKQDQQLYGKQKRSEQQGCAANLE